MGEKLDTVLPEVNWFTIASDYRDSIILIDIEHPRTVYQIDNDTVSRKDLMLANNYITYRVNKYNGTGAVIKYLILERFVDEYNNLIIFAKYETIGFEQ
ncbi:MULTISPECIES: hypothetical protein [Brevibacillus]|uniref:hypothetical protein n=1 Tax=Brevibacillus TaxID=55080 RepID=UPI0024573DDB|nr:MULTISPECIES: hypothetical protein [Brevibacillus]MDH4619964.1 hypothetical protein [Brevibacillus sp. AY1]MED1951823.1 hypothetical protein [Brevibacillus centrosporus]